MNNAEIEKALSETIAVLVEKQKNKELSIDQSLNLLSILSGLRNPYFTGASVLNG